MDNVHYHLDYATAARITDDAVFDFKEKILDQLVILVDQSKSTDSTDTTDTTDSTEITTEMVNKATNIVNLAWHKERILKHEAHIRQIEAKLQSQPN